MSCHKRTRVKKQKHTFSEGKVSKNCERTRKIVKEPGKKRETMQMTSFFVHAF